MCGIAGYWTSTEKLKPEVLDRMIQTLNYRGPDDSGVWFESAAGLALGHKRLAVIDLSCAGKQPMLSACGRFTLVFNGEIYNHLRLRADLAEQFGSITWRGRSDSETLLVSLSNWGLVPTLQRLNGMFAFALWDSKLRKLFLARDRIGEKPLYYSSSDNTFLFGSELRALLQWPEFSQTIDREALTLFLQLGYVPSPHAIFEQVEKLPPGSYIEVTDRRSGLPQQYWSIGSAIDEANSLAESTGSASDADSIGALDTLLGDSVSLRLNSDVPLGVFLSGGVDSSLVTALAQKNALQRLKTFTIGFEESEFDESSQARGVAGFLGTDHTELMLNSTTAIDLVYQVPEMFDEPFADESQLPTYLVAQLARKSVTVALSGDGGDESFGGYNRYFVGRRMWHAAQAMPRWLRVLLSKLALNAGNGGYAMLMSALRKFRKGELTSEQLLKLSLLLRDDSPDDVYWHMISIPSSEDLVIKGNNHPLGEKKAFREFLKHDSLTDFSARMMAADTSSYLPDDILTKLDRTTMAVSLEGRTPLLDHRLVEFAWQLPLDKKIRNNQGKWILRELLYRYVPKKLVERPKSGFTIPVSQWLRGPLRDWAESLLDERSIREQGLLDAALVRRIWESHISGVENRGTELWRVLMFQAWYSRWVRSK